MTGMVGVPVGRDSELEFSRLAPGVFEFSLHGGAFAGNPGVDEHKATPGLCQEAVATRADGLDQCTGQLMRSVGIEACLNKVGELIGWEDAPEETV